MILLVEEGGGGSMMGRRPESVEDILLFRGRGEVAIGKKVKTKEKYGDVGV